MCETSVNAILNKPTSPILQQFTTFQTCICAAFSGLCALIKAILVKQRSAWCREGILSSSGFVSS